MQSPIVLYSVQYSLPSLNTSCLSDMPSVSFTADNKLAYHHKFITGARKPWRLRSHGWPNFGQRLVLIQVFGRLNHFCEQLSNNMTNFVWLLIDYVTFVLVCLCSPVGLLYVSIPAPRQLGQSTSRKNVGNNIVLLLHIFIFYTACQNH